MEPQSVIQDVMKISVIKKKKIKKKEKVKNGLSCFQGDFFLSLETHLIGRTKCSAKIHRYIELSNAYDFQFHRVTCNDWSLIQVNLICLSEFLLTGCRNPTGIGLDYTIQWNPRPSYALAVKSRQVVLEVSLIEADSY